MTDAARTLLVACALSAIAAATFVMRMRRLDAESPERLIAELRAANVAALLLAATGAAGIGFTVAHATAATAALETALALMFVGAAGAMLFREPREALWIGALGFIAHAVIDLAHRSGGLSIEIFPHWYLIAGAVYDGCLAGLCFLARQRS